MAAGLPVVSTAVSGIPELVTDGCDGLLVPPEDPQRLAAAIRALVASPEDQARLACAGRITVASRFDGDVLADRLATMFRQVAS
jgi:glycosyltransferase involved in cell wall biosynthesis